MRRNNLMTMTTTICSSFVFVVAVAVIVIAVTCCVNANVETAQNKMELSEFKVVLATVVQQSMDHLAKYDPIKRAVNSLQDELSKPNDSKTEKKAKKKADKKGLMEAVEDLMGTVDTFFDDKSDSPKKKHAKKNKVASMFAEYDKFTAELKSTLQVDYWRLGRIAGLSLELMSSRPKMREDIAEGIAELFHLPKNINLVEILNVASQTMAMWKTPLGQQLIKPVLDQMMTNFLKSNFDVNAVKPSVEILLTTIFGADSQRQIKPIMEVAFRLIDRVIKIVLKSGLGNLVMNFNANRTLQAAQEIYVEVFLSFIDPLNEVVQNCDSLIDAIENILDVTRRYRNVPGTMDVRFRRGDINDPVAKVKSIVLQIERAKMEIEESRHAIIGFHAYPIRHPSQAIEAIKQLVRTLKNGEKALNDFWPLRGFLKFHPFVKGQINVIHDVEELKMNSRRALDKTHKIQVLIDDIKNLDSVFDAKQIFEDVLAILRGHPKLGFLVIFLDLFKGEFDNLKEIAYNGF